MNQDELDFKTRIKSTVMYGPLCDVMSQLDKILDALPDDINDFYNKLQSLSAENDTLKGRIEKLEAEISDMRSTKST